MGPRGSRWTTHPKPSSQWAPYCDGLAHRAQRLQARCVRWNMPDHVKGPRERRSRCNILRGSICIPKKSQPNSDKRSINGLHKPTCFFTACGDYLSARMSGCAENDVQHILSEGSFRRALGHQSAQTGRLTSLYGETHIKPRHPMVSAKGDSDDFRCQREKFVGTVEAIFTRLVSTSDFG
ncbi:hypothetical protein BDR05DRAFT_951244 [Suillus weaverae]|nr:hypothetical protein BDR05DRAFT_951244 [Suillus weaverae]